jgi:hypothetical protein
LWRKEGDKKMQSLKKVEGMDKVKIGIIIMAISYVLTLLAFASFWILILPAILVVGTSFWLYSSTGKTGSNPRVGSRFGSSNIPFEPKVHCGFCGKQMKPNMAFCPNCGNRQTPAV